MFVRYVMIICTAAAVALTGCSSHKFGQTAPAPRPLWNELAAYQAPSEFDPHGALPEEAWEPEGVLELRNALALALLHNPTLAEVSWSVRISEARSLQAGLVPNPELEVEIEEFGGEGPRREFDASETSIRLSQLIELGGKRGARRRIAGVETQLARYDYETKRLTVLTDATLAFIDLLAGQERLILAEDLHRLSEETFAVVTERVRAGKVSPLEETKASIELANRKIELIQANNNVLTTRKRLAATWGSGVPQFSRAAGTLGRIEEIPPLDALEAFIHTNPAAARWAEEMERCLAALALERAQRMFDLTVSAGIRRFEESDDHAFTIGLSLPIPLFDRNQGGVREARYRIAQTEHQKSAAHVRINTALLESYSALTGARAEALALENEIVPAAGRAFEAARHGYRQGKFGYLEVLDAQRTFAETNARLLDAQARYHRAAALVESLVGTSLDSLLEDRSTQLEERP